jgi:hypothetical protein
MVYRIVLIAKIIVVVIMTVGVLTVAAFAAYIAINKLEGRVPAWLAGFTAALAVSALGFGMLWLLTMPLNL